MQAPLGATPAGDPARGGCPAACMPIEGSAMSDFTPQIVPLGSLNEAAIVGADLAQQEAQSIGPTGPGTLTGYIAP
jgi:hypothetical protein